MNKKLSSVLSLFLSLIPLLVLSPFLFSCGTENNKNTPDVPVTEGSAGLTYELSENGDYAICTGIGTATDNEITIASHYENVVVKEIETKAFNENATIEILTIPKGVEKINQKAFYNCALLKDVEISNTVVEIGPNAFNNCLKLLSVTIENDNALTKIGLYAFAECTSLEYFSIGDNSQLKTISTFAFNNCKKMTYFELGKNSKLEEIGNMAFQYTDGLEKFFIPQSVERIGGYCFGGIGYDEKNGYQSTWIYVEAQSTGISWDGFWNSSNAHVTFGKTYDDYLNDRK